MRTGPARLLPPVSVAFVAAAAGSILAAAAPRADPALAAEGGSASPYRWWRSGGDGSPRVLAGATVLAVPRAAAAVFLEDGRRVLAASVDGGLTVFDAGGAVLRTLPGPRRPRVLLRTGPGDRFLVAGADGDARLVDADGGVEHRLEGLAGWVWCGDAAPAAGRCATGSTDGSASVWDQRGRPLLRVAKEGGRVLAVALSPDGGTLFTADTCGRGRFWDAAGALLHERLLPGGEPRARFLADGSGVLLVAGGAAWILPADGTAGTPLEGVGPVRVVREVPGGRGVLLGGVNGRVALAGRDGVVTASHRGHRGMVMAAAVTASGDILTAALDATVRRYGGGLEPGGVAEVPPGAPFSLEASADGARLLLVFTDESRSPPLVTAVPTPPPPRPGSESTAPPRAR